MTLSRNSSKLTLAEVSKSLQSFGWIDYLLFMGMLLICAFIGIYFALKENKKQKSPNRRRQSLEDGYLVGNRNMQVFPVAMSLIASWISGIALLGMPTEIYIYGSEFMYMLGSIFLCGIIMNYIFLPVFLDLKLTSTYEYLETRFDRSLRLLGAVIFTIATLVKMPIVIYVPALAFNQVTGINIHIITPVVCVVCIFYTTVGGIKAVVWTDVVQTIIMYITMFLIIIKGVYDLGGLSVVWERNYASNRIVAPQFTLDPTVRHSFISMLIGGTLLWTQINSVSQCMVQRYLALPSLKAARRSLWILVFGVMMLLFMSCYNGLIIYATYYDCDPLTTKLAKAKDQLLPLLIMDLFKNYPGIPGIFIAGVFSAALSSLSTGLNSLAAITLEDFVKPCASKPLTQNQTNFIMRGVVVFYGFVSVALVFLVAKLGSVLALSISLAGVTIGPLFAVFLIGLTLPWLGSKSVFTGAVTALLVMSWITFKTQKALALGEIIFATKPVTTEGCSYIFESIINNNQTIFSDASFETPKTIYHMSYLWYTSLSILITVTVSFLTSFIFGFNRPSDVPPYVLAPFIRKYINYDNTKFEMPKNKEKNKLENQHFILK